MSLITSSIVHLRKTYHFWAKILGIKSDLSCEESLKGSASVTQDYLLTRLKKPQVSEIKLVDEWPRVSRCSRLLNALLVADVEIFSSWTFPVLRLPSTHSPLFSLWVYDDRQQRRRTSTGTNHPHHHPPTPSLSALKLKLWQVTAVIFQSDQRG